jgi:hypothetical protein
MEAAGIEPPQRLRSHVGGVAQLDPSSTPQAYSELGARVDVELSIDAGEVRFDRPAADEHLG